jgi:predicted dehydrogenase
MYRRTFIKKSGIISSGILTLPSLVTSCSSANDRINLALIGSGPRGVALLNEFIKSYDVHILAVCDPFRDRRENLAVKVDEIQGKKYEKQTYKSCMAYSNYTNLLTNREIDAIIIATPDHWHVKIAIEAARAGKHVYLEKPLGLSIEQGQILQDVIQKTRVCPQPKNWQTGKH